MGRNMKNRHLEDIVPPMKLCQRIPNGKFANSVLVWDCSHGWVILRPPDAELFGRVPAPTLEEIMEEMRKDHEQVAVTNRQSGGWCVHGWDFLPEDDKNAATAAIRVFLRSVRATR